VWLDNVQLFGLGHKWLLAEGREALKRLGIQLASHAFWKIMKFSHEINHGIPFLFGAGIV
jgi:hypothetical protein